MVGEGSVSKEKTASPGGAEMSYHYSKIVESSFDEAIDLVTAALAVEGFGVLTDIDIKATMRKKLDVDFRPYRILGACNPGFAYKALQAEDKIGAMLPCNVVVQQLEDGRVEVSAVDPMASMQAVESEALGEIATSVADKLKRVVDGL